MAYSETYGTKVISVQTLIDHGARRAGKLAEELTSEQLLSARESLYYVLSNLINLGIQYWAIGKKVYGLKADQAKYLLPVGGVDVLNGLYRTLNRPTGTYASSAGGTADNAFDGDVATVCTQTSTNGNLSVFYGADNPIYAGSIGVLPGVSGAFNVVFETSDDGVTWTTLYAPGAETWVDDEWIWHDIEPGASATYYRMRETGGNTLVVRELFIGNNSTEVPMARLNRDDYTSLPNKNFTANNPYQFYFERTVPQASINLWPVPSNNFVQMTIWYSKQVMDVGALTNEIEIPQRWLLAIQSMLAHQMALEMPAVDLARVQYLEAQAEKHFYQAEQEERDKSGIYFSPNISVYTR